MNGGNSMHLKRITQTAHPMYSSALALYAASFPFHEQREALSQAEILGNREYHFCLAYDGDAFIGLLLYWETGCFIYIEHLCILPEMRNKKYGQRALGLLQEKQKILILEIDPPLDDISRRRKGFYERCGFAGNPYPHIHPPYHRGSRGHDLVVMTWPRQISQDAYDAFRQYLQERVMHNPFA